MDAVVNQWYVAEVAGYSEIVANLLRFFRRKKLLFRFSFVLPAFGNSSSTEKRFLILFGIGVIFTRNQ